MSQQELKRVEVFALRRSGQIKQAEAAPPKANPYRKLLVVRVAKNHRVLVTSVGALEEQKTEVPRAIGCYAVALFGDLVALEGQRVTQHIDDAIMRNLRSFRVSSYSLKIA